MCCTPGFLIIYNVCVFFTVVIICLQPLPRTVHFTTCLAFAGLNSVHIGTPAVHGRARMVELPSPSDGWCQITGVARV
jgi:hypothetical protein